VRAENFSVVTPALNDFYKKLPPASGKGAAIVGTTENSASGNIFKFLFFAFLGGLILNLMPCVLPVISIKLFGLIKHKNLPKTQIVSHNLAYTAGILSTFMALGAVVAAIKAGGEEIGWGFQLQSPGFILVMMLILFVLSLNLFGLFEFVTPGGATLGSTELKEGFAGDFFSGVLTTILSTPCSAPFLGTALTFAFTTGTSSIFLIFTMVGIGLAFPFLLTAFFPATLNIFPRPGLWMEKLKYFLGLSLVVTVIWLYDVFVRLVHFDVISWRLNMLFALWFFAFFFARKVSTGRPAQIVMFMLPVALTVMAIRNLPMRPVSGETAFKTNSQWIPWSEAKLQETKGKVVFMDFTAEWCLTCKVNKKLVMETDAFIKMATKNELVLMRADWTRRDDNITQFLKGFGIKVANSVFLSKDDQLDAKDLVIKLGLPIFVKPSDSGSSYGISKVKSTEEVLPAFQKAFGEGDTVVAESFLDGVEVTCGVFRRKDGVYALPLTEIASENEFFDYDAKYLGKSSEITPARVDDVVRNEVQRQAKYIYQLLRLRSIARIDFMIVNGVPHVIEVNTTPGFSPASIVPQMLACDGITIQDFWKEILEVELKIS
jgi:thiol:disulfide interchange protein DsbD